MGKCRCEDKAESDPSEESRGGAPAKKGCAAGTVLGLALAAAAGGTLGAADFFYEYALTPKRHDTRGDDRPSERPYAEGRRWMNLHERRKDLFLTSPEGLRLHANYIPAADPACHRYAVCVHGYADSSESMGLYARHYYDRYGMNVLLPDLRGHGASQGSYVGMGLDDSHDTAAWIRRIVRKDPEAVIVLHGISMGAATVLLATGLPLPEQVKAAVSDAAYTSAYEEFKAVYAHTANAAIPAPVMLELVRAIALVRAHYDLKKASPLEAVKLSRTPTLFIHGDSDGFIAPSMMTDLYEAAACPKECAWFEGADHVQSVVVDPAGYWEKVDSFLNGISPDILGKPLS